MNKKNLEILIRSSLRRFPINLVKTAASLFSMLKSGERAFLPYKLQIESSAVCNLKCRMCPQNIMRREKGYLKFEIFKKIFDEVKPPYLNLTGLGEPLLNPDIFKIISYAKKKRSFIKMDTNATLLTEQNIRKILGAGIDIISISFDGIDKKTYESIRIGANFEKVMFNVKRLVGERNKSKSKTEIHLFLVLQKDNFKQFPEFIKFGNFIGVDSISGTFIAEESYEKNKDVNIEKCNEKELKELLEKLKKIKKKVKINLEIDEIVEYIATWKKKKNKNWKKVPCYVPWYSPFITWDGILTPCCYCVDKEIVFGDLKTTSFKKLWNGMKLKKFRKMVSTKRIGLCSKCEADESYIKNIFRKIPFYKIINKRRD